MRIAIGQITHETNTFSNVKTTKQLFQQYEWLEGEEILSAHNGVRDYLGGMIDEAREKDIEVLPTFSANCNPSGTITKETYENLKDSLLMQLKSAGDFDAICLNLHGAGTAEGADDLEGSLLKEIRNAFGYEIPIVSTLDLHGNITETMVREANALLGVNYYPHVDCYERGREAMDIAIRTVKGEINPVTRFVKMPLIIPLSTTDQAPAEEINKLCWDWEKEEGLLDCTFFHGFYCTDIPYVGTSVVAVADGNESLAEKACANVAEAIWKKKDQFNINYPTPKEGLEQAIKEEKFPVVINEMSDNPGGGAPGDGTYLLRELIEKNLPKTCLGFIYDPEVAELAHKAGIGSQIEVELGGKTDSLHGKPVKVTAYVKCLTDGKFSHSSPMVQGKTVNYKKTARLQVGNVDIIVCSVRAQTLDEQVFLLHGIDVRDYKIVCLKSSIHFRASYKPIAAKIITVDSPGLSTSKIESFNYTRINRPIYPLDHVHSFNPLQPIK
jgi:microcystin degradation protein MlrC